MKRCPSDNGASFSSSPASSSSSSRRLRPFFLLDRGGDVNAADANGWVPLTYAAQNGHAAVVELLLSQPECDAGVADGDGCVRE